MAREFIMPQHIVTGEQALQKAGNYFVTMGTKALIVSDPMMVKLHNVDALIDVLSKLGIEFVTYTDITGEPSDDMIMKGVSLYQEKQCDFLIAIGGGSPIDAMKAIGAVVTNKGNINDYLGKVITECTPAMAAIPTTAGTGSEATQFTIITNTKENIKMLLKGPALMPDLAIIDPHFTMSAPAAITASTGLDALCHAVESYTSIHAQALSKTFSISAIKKIMTYLPMAYDDGSNVVAREQMAIAALEAGIAFNNSSVTIIHGMSRPIGALYHIPHGLSNAMLLNTCFTFVVEKAQGVFATLARECGLADEQDNDMQASDKILCKMKALVAYCHVATLEEFGVSKEEFFHNISKMAKDAMESGSPQNTPRECTKEDIKGLYRALWK